MDSTTQQNNTGQYNVPNTQTLGTINNSGNLNLTPPPVIPNVAGTLTGLASNLQADAVASQNKADTATNDFSSLLKQYLEQSTEKAQLQQQYDTAGLGKKVRDLQSLQSSQTAQYIQGLNNIELAKNTRQEANAQSIMLNRQHGIDALLTGAQLQSAQGNVEYANNLIKNALDLKYEPIKAQLDYQKEILSQLNTKAATAQTRAYEIQKTRFENEQKLVEKGIDNINTQIKEGKINAAAGNKAISDLIAGKVKASDVFATLGITGQGNPGIVGGYDISKYATDPQHEIKVASIYSSIPNLPDAKTADQTIKSLYPNSPITGTMIISAASNFRVDPKIVFAIMAQDSSMGTAGIGAKNFNPGNIGQFDTLGKTPTTGYKSWQEGVNAVAEWLSKHKATGIYNGEFGSTLEQIAQLGNGTDKSKEIALQTLQNAVASKDYRNAYQIGINRVSDQLPTAEEKAQFSAKQRAIPAAESLKEKLQEYVAANGDMGLLKGTAENIEAKLGKVKDPALRTLATELKIAFQTYRKDMSGAAFSVSESADYESVNPTSKKELRLNLAILDGMISSFKNSVDSTIESKAPGLKNIRELAEYQGLSQPQILTKLASKNPNTRSFIDSERAKGTPPDIVLAALGYENLTQ